MLAGELYDPLDPELVAGRARARDLCQALNATREGEPEERRRILRELFGGGGESVWMQPPFFCDYGANIELGERVFFNFNCVVLDVCPVRIGSFTLFGPAVQILTPMHPFDAELRRKQEFGKPIDDRLGCVGRRRGDHPAGRAHRIAGGDRCRQRGDARCPRRRVCGGQPLPGDPRDHARRVRSPLPYYPANPTKTRARSIGWHALGSIATSGSRQLFALARVAGEGQGEGPLTVAPPFPSPAGLTAAASPRGEAQICAVEAARFSWGTSRQRVSPDVAGPKQAHATSDPGVTRARGARTDYLSGPRRWSWRT